MTLLRAESISTLKLQLGVDESIVLDPNACSGDLRLVLSGKARHVETRYHRSHSLERLSGVEAAGHKVDRRVLFSSEDTWDIRGKKTVGIHWVQLARWRNGENKTYTVSEFERTQRR